MSFHFLSSAILRGRWLLDKTFAESQMPLVMQLMRGEKVDFAFANQKNADEKKPLAAERMAGVKASSVYGVRPRTDLAGIPDGSIVVYTIAGPMVKRGDYCDYGMIDHADAINRLRNSPNIAGIILDMDSPGGQADGTAMLADTIRATRQTKPVITMVDDGLLASAGYWIGASADEIYVTQSTTQVGSIGVYTTVADFNAHYADYWKLPVKDVYAPQSTDKNGAYMEALKGNDEPLKEDLSVMADEFIGSVIKDRGGRLKGEAWKTGAMFYSKAAQKEGLIDGQKSFSQIVDRMNVLIKQRKNSSFKSSNNMAFEKSLAAAKATEFAVTDDGFAMSEDNLNNIEAALTTAETNAGLVATLNTTVNSLNGKISEMTTAANTAATTISANATRIQELEAQVAALGKGSSGKGTVLKTAGDANTGEQKSEHKYAGDDFADEKMGKRSAEKPLSEFK